jgi:N-acetylneuraminic acid mutarotase
MRRRTRIDRVVLASVVAFASTALTAPPAGSHAGPTAAAISPGVWATDTPSGFKRQEVTYVTVGSRIYLAGGRSTRQQVFDPQTHSWANVAPLPVALDHIQATELNGLIYYVGGLNGYPGSSYGGVNVYDPGTNTIASAAPLPAGRDRGAGGIVTYQGKIYVAGGFHTGGSVAWFDVYDPATNTWKSLPDMPERRDHVSAAVVAGKLYVIGGRTYGTGPRSENDVYDFATGRWATGLARLPTLRSGSATAVFGGEVVVIGGELYGTGTFNNVEAYNTMTNTWRSMTSMPTARHGIQAAMFNGSAYISDGGTKMGGGAPTDVQEVFSIGDSDPPTVPGKPSGVSVRPGEIDLIWAASTDGGSSQITYQVFRDGNPTPVGTITSSSLTQVSYTDKGLLPSSVHRYVVKAVDTAGNASVPSELSDPITVQAAPTSIFADDFSSGGFSNWTAVTRLTIDPTLGGVAPPSARAQVSNLAAWAFKTLPGTYGSVCMSERVNATSLAGYRALLRLRTAANGPVSRVWVNAAGMLWVKSDVSGAQISSGVVLGSGWHTIELCGTVGTAGTWSLYRDGVRFVNNWVANTGTTPIGRIEIGDAAAGTYTVNFDDVVVDQVAGG